MKVADLADLLEPSDSCRDGHLILRGGPVTWTLYFARGQLLYAADELHPRRRWERNLKQYFPSYEGTAERTAPHQDWQIRSLDQGIQQQKLSLIRVKLVIRRILQECLFELSQCVHLATEWQPVALPVSPVCRSVALSHLETKVVCRQAEHLQQQWQKAGLPLLSPTLSPVLADSANTLAWSSLSIKHQYLRGDFTLWDLAIKLDQSLVDVTRSLWSSAQQEQLTFESLPDLSSPVPGSVASPAPIPAATIRDLASPGGAPKKRHLSVVADETSTPSLASASTREQPLIACIDDSPVLAHSLKKILESSGYRTLIIQEPMRGFSQLIEHKPNLILLDLMLPNADGYSVCKFLRDTPVFEKTPIIILTGRSKPVDRARALLSGATEFLVKPPEPNQLLALVRKQLRAASPSSAIAAV